jgi:integrase
MVLLIGSTGVRRSELMALVWTDINVETMEVSITKSCVRNRLGDTKTECSRRPVPLHPLSWNLCSTGSINRYIKAMATSCSRRFG